MEIGAFLKYSKGLGFEEKPDYKFWRDVFRGVINRLYPPNQIKIW
jgi:hypothetical protein